jgi:hypothetical protein
MKNYCNILWITGIISGFFAADISAVPSEHFKVFLCFGQSNMSGGAGCNPDNDSKSTKPRVKVLSFANCSSPTRTANTWTDAREPMHCGDGQDMMGPSYVFGQMLADSLPGDTIGLIPCGLWGVGIEMFVKGGNYTGSNKPSLMNGKNNAWDWMLTKCKLAVERGTFSGIILHQGEANSGQSTWLKQVKTIYNDLIKELALKNDIPLVAGELLQGENLNPKPCCAGHNVEVNKIPGALPFGYVASSQGLVGGGSLPQYHFSTDGYRQMGKRFAIEMLKGLRAIQTSTTPRPSPKRSLTLKNLQETSATSLYTINGKKLPAGSLQEIVSGKKHCIYVMQQSASKASLVINLD